MSQHHATIRWANAGSEFLGGRYLRAHTWSFDGGLTVPGSSSPSVVPAPLSDPAAVDPEEAFVAALSSCHMLTFLHVARRAGFAIESYEDAAVGDMAKNERGVPFVKVVTLNPASSTPVTSDPRPRPWPSSTTMPMNSASSPSRSRPRWS